MAFFNPKQQNASGTTDSVWLPLQNQLFKIIWIGTVISNIGTWMQNVGATLQMVSMTSSHSLIALVQAAGLG